MPSLGKYRMDALARLVVGGLYLLIFLALVAPIVLTVGIVIAVVDIAAQLLLNREGIMPMNLFTRSWKWVIGNVTWTLTGKGSFTIWPFWRRGDASPANNPNPLPILWPAWTRVRVPESAVFPMHRRTFILGLLVVAVAVAGAQPAAAQTDDPGLLDTITGGDVTLTERVSAANDAISGILSRVQYEAATASGIGDSNDSTSADGAATDLATVYSDNSDSIEAYVNARFEGDAGEWNVIRIDVALGSETATRYLVADVSNESFTNSTMTTTTDRSVDAMVGVEDYAAVQATDELQRFVDEYVAEDRDIDAALRRRLAQQYGGDIDLPEEINT